MRPLKPIERRQILENKSHIKTSSVNAAINEYESLMSEHFKADSTRPLSPESINIQKKRENRIEELYRFLFQDEDNPQGFVEK